MKSANKSFGLRENAAVKVLNYTVLILLTIMVLFPLYFAFVISFKTNQEYLNTSPISLPHNFLNFDNYLFLFKNANLPRAFGNTMLFVVTSVVGSVLMGSMVAFALARLNLKYSKYIMLLFIIPMFIPGLTTQVSVFNIISSMHLYNTIYAGIVLYLAADIVQIYLFTQFIEKVPRELDESARMEGASYFRVYWNIIVPQLVPAFATVAILRVVGIYNDLLTPYLYMPKSSLKTVTTALMSFATDRGTQWNMMTAGIVTIMIPTILLYLFLQRFIIAGLTDGAVK
ncbi:carbohydrate ABC transporter permease [Cohnella sp. 56]|uniref:carbohydrate ABC transporter permease n=1 Tax=Cohnella sp. 56 TaxID=3113722 RepID=UPI0030EAFC73